MKAVRKVTPIDIRLTASGDPGRGKTRVLMIVIEHLEKLGYKIKLDDDLHTIEVRKS